MIRLYYSRWGWYFWLAMQIGWSAGWLLIQFVWGTWWVAAIFIVGIYLNIVNWKKYNAHRRQWWFGFSRIPTSDLRDPRRKR